MQKTLKWQVAQQAEIRWWKNYLREKDVPDYLQKKKAYWKKIWDLLAADLQLNAGDSVLDAGCGPAGIFMILDNFETDAEDPLLDHYDEKLDHFKKAWYPNVNFFSVPFEKFQNEKLYDAVFCMNAINHVADLKMCFDKLIEFTKPGKNLIITIDAHNYSFFKNLFRIIPGDILHPHQFDLNEYKKMLSERNCTIEKTIPLKHEFFFDHYLIIAKRNLI
jgi:2-polyprenyl-3-methyl-5-hydroxy-6-metoxy-1,4-benzoquinol methylase